MLLSKYSLKKKYLIGKQKKCAGRNNTGRITVAHQGGGHKQSYRKIMFDHFLNTNYQNFITNFEYDPNRTAFLAKICAVSKTSKNFKKINYKYILAPKTLKILDSLDNYLVDTKKTITTLSKQIGNYYFLNDLSIGDLIYNIQINNTKGHQFVRAGGTFAVILNKNAEYATIKLPSNEYRNVPLNFRACLGALSNSEHNKKSLKKAGKSRWLNRRPTVRGVAKNPIDHPHGGNTSGGCHPVTP